MPNLHPQDVIRAYATLPVTISHHGFGDAIPEYKEIGTCKGVYCPMKVHSPPEGYR